MHMCRCHDPRCVLVCRPHYAVCLCVALTLGRWRQDPASGLWSCCNDASVTTITSAEIEAKFGAAQRGLEQDEGEG